MSERKLGIVIGTNEYSDSKIRNLRFAEKDAKDIKNILLSPDICGFDKVVEVINEHSTDSLCEVEQLFDEAEQDDVILIYFSGHGELDKQNELCLLFKNTKIDRLLATSLNYSMIRKCINSSRCQTTIVILDCCYSGAATVKGTNISGILDKTVDKVVDNENSFSGTVILSASSEFDVAKEDEKLKNSVFTYYLVEGLKSGAIAGDNYGNITLDDLYYYAYEKTTKYSQTPYQKVDCKGKVIIGKNPLKVKENNFNSKLDKLVKIYADGLLPSDIYDTSMTVLIAAYEKPNELTEDYRKMSKSLEDFLEGKIRDKTYIHTFQYYKKKAKDEDLHALAKLKKQEIPEISIRSTTDLEREVFEVKEKIKLESIRIPEAFTSPSTGMEFVLIPAGEFMMGSKETDNSQPIHKVIIRKPFYLGRYPVTQKQWKTVMESNLSLDHFKDLKKACLRIHNYRINSSKSKDDARPIACVSWYDAQDFIKKLNQMESTEKYRLPSEAEWEYACRAGTKTIFFFGDDKSLLKNYAYHGFWNKMGTSPVGEKKPNPWGLYDMNGNVWEWCQDRKHNNYNGAPSNGSAWEDGDSSERVCRGGDYESLSSTCQSAFRNFYISSNYLMIPDDIGFRLVREI